MQQIKRNILLNPGPGTTTDSVKMAQVVPDICPREKEFNTIVKSVCNDLTKIAGGGTNYITVLFGGSGTSAMDATINSVVPPNKKILIINNGMYGERMTKIAKAYDIGVVELQFEWGKLPDLQKIEESLKNEKDIECVAVIHHETTTGLLNPIHEIGQLAKKYNKVYVVDAISSFAGLPLDVVECHIDFMMSSSNKCIQGMAGVCFIICKKDELEKMKDCPKRSFYLDLYDQYKFFKDKGEMRFTTPVQTIYALRKAIDEFFEEGAENRYSRYTKNWEVLRKGVVDMGFKLLTKPEEESHILITILYPEDPNFDYDLLHDKLYEKGFTIYPARIGKINAFRLANLGAIDYRDIENFLSEMRNTLENIGVKLP